MTIPRSLVLAIAALMATLGGCQSRMASYQEKESTKYSIENTGKFARLDTATQAAIICTGLQEHATDDGRLEVVANVKNRASTEIQVRARCIFKDLNGFAIGDETPWQLLTLGDEATEAVRFTATKREAMNYTVTVRSP